MKTSIPCRMLEHTGRTRYSLRRYNGDGKCTLPRGYHDAQSEPVGETADDLSKDYFGSNPPAIEATDARWPKACACGYAFTDSDKSQVFAHPLFKFVDTGEVVTLDAAPAGAMWDASWWPDKGADGKAWSVRLPDGSDWMTEGGAANCSCRKSATTADHRCWSRTGVAPRLTVSPSIATPRWHGWLKDGVLIQA